MKHITLLLFALTFPISALAALPPQIEADRLLLQAKATLDAGDYDNAIQSFEKAEKLNVKMPETFYFHFGKAYSGAKKWEKARATYEKYLHKSGTKGKFYREALEGFNQADIEVSKSEKADAEAMARYTEVQNLYESNMRNCPNEYAKSLESLESETEGLRQKCIHWDPRFVQYDSCGTSENSEGLALSRAWKSAEKRLSEMPSYGDDAWCKNRYTAPRKPERLP